MRRAVVPDAFQVERSKPEIALAELKRLLKVGVRFGAVVADAGYGISPSSLLRGSLPRAGADDAGPHGEAHVTRVCAALRQSAQER